MEYSNLFVCLMGMGTVFLGLACLVVLLRIMGRLCCRKGTTTNPPQTSVSETSLPPEKKAELLAAITAAVAENLHTDTSAIRIVSIKRV